MDTKVGIKDIFNPVLVVKRDRWLVRNLFYLRYSKTSHLHPPLRHTAYKRLPKRGRGRPETYTLTSYTRGHRTGNETPINDNWNLLNWIDNTPSVYSQVFLFNNFKTIREGKRHFINPSVVSMSFIRFCSIFVFFSSSGSPRTCTLLWSLLPICFKDTESLWMREHSSHICNRHWKEFRSNLYFWPI